MDELLPSWVRETLSDFAAQKRNGQIVLHYAEGEIELVEEHKRKKKPKIDNKAPVG